MPGHHRRRRRHLHRPARSDHRFLGPIGAGKSTTMRIIVGLTQANSGTATLLDAGSRSIPTRGWGPGVLLDASAQHAGRTGREILSLAQLTMGPPAQRVTVVLDLVSLTGTEADRRVANYSLGMRQRLGLAVALIGHPTTPDPRRAGQRAGPRRDPLDA